MTLYRIFHALISSLLLSLAACGGGSSDPDPAPLVLSVKVNGGTVSSDAPIEVKPGDAVEVVASEPASFTASAAEGGAISLRDASVGSTSWNARIVNELSTPTVYTVVAAAAAHAGNTAQAVLKVAGGDPRNGQYTVASTSLRMESLLVNFDLGTYTMTDAGAMLTGSFAADPATPGTYVFASSRITSAANTARFRATADAVVGNFPFTSPLRNGSYEVLPFIAARKLVTAQAELDGTQNRFRITLAGGARTSSVAQQEISGGGTVLRRCADNTIHGVADCPAASIQTYSIVSTGEAGAWRLTNVVAPSDTGVFRMARVGRDNIYLAAGISGTNSLFSIAIPALAPAASVLARGGSTTGDYGQFIVDADAYRGSLLRPGGMSASFSLGLTRAELPVGLASARSESGMRYYVSQSSSIVARVGARSDLSTTGYMELGLID